MADPREEHASIAFGRGVDTKTAERLVEAPTLLTAQNVSYETPGQAGKRRGYEAVATTGLTAGSVPSTLGSLGNARLTLTNLGLSTFRDALGTNAPTQTPGWPLPCAVAQTRIARPDSRAIRCDAAQSGNFLCVAWDNGTDIFVMVTDRTTMQVTLQRTRQFSGIGASVGPRVLVLGSTFVVLGWVVDRIRAFTITGGNTLTPSVDVSGAATNATYDAVVNNAGDRIHILTSDAATNNVTLFRVALVAGVPTQDATATIAVNGSFASGILHHSLGRLFLAFAAPAALLRMATINNDYTGVSGVINMSALTGLAVEGVTLVEANPNNTLGFTGVWAVWNESSDVAPSISDSTLVSFTNLALVAGDMRKVRWQGLSTAPAAVGVAQENAHMYLAAKGFRPTTAVANMPSIACFVAAYSYSGATILPDGTRAPGSAQPCLYVMRIPQDAVFDTATDRLQVLARVNQDRAVYGHSFPPQVFTTATNQFRFACLSRVLSVDRNTDTSFDGVDIVDLDFTAGALPRAERSGAAFFGGGLLSYFAGDRAGESSLNVYPERPYFLQGAAGNVDNAEHRYVVVWEYPDEAGNLHRSAPSPPLTVPAQGGAFAMGIHFPAIGGYTQRNGTNSFNVVAAVYRTVASDAFLHRVVSGVPAASAVIGLVNLTDNLSDGDAANNEQLYTVFGRAATAPPAPTDIAFSRDRMWIATANQLWYSKPLEALVAPELHGLQVIEIAAGTVTAIAVMDDKIIVFTADRVFVIDGDGPDALGTGGTFSLPTQIPSDVGCVSRGSVVVYPGGVIFQSAKGLYRVDRALQVTYFGAAVEDDLVGAATGLPNATITRATLYAARNEIRFLVPQNGTTIVYDYIADAWHRASNFDTAVDAIVIDNRYQWIRNDLRGRRERTVADATPFADLSAADAAIYIPTTIETAWFKLEGLQGYVCLWEVLLLGYNAGAHALTVEARYDYEAAYTQTWTFSAAEIAAIRYRTGDASATRYQLQLNIARTEAQAVAFRFRDTNATPTGGFTLGALELVYGRLGRSMPLPATAAK